MASDGDLMLAVKDGDLEAFNTIVERHHASLINYFFRLVWDHSKAEDLAQDVFCKLFETANKYQKTAKFTTFMYRVAHNHYVDYLRKIKSRPQEIPIESNNDDEASIANIFVSETPDPSKQLISKEILGKILKAVGSLDEIYREAFVLCVYQGMKYIEAANVLEVPEGTVKSRMFSAVRKLREILGEYCLLGNNASFNEVEKNHE